MMMRRSGASGLLTLLGLALVIAACSRSGSSGSGGTAPPPVPVTVATAVSKPMPVELRAIGTVQPSNSVTVRARVGGILAQVHFREGQDVKEGDVLFTLDGGPLEAELRQAQANLARSQAQLNNARKDAERYTELARQGFVAQQQADQAQTAAASLEATVRADQAVVENARIQRGYATIRAPIAGRTGALLVHEGDLIKVSDTPMVVLNQIRPVDIAFALPERELPEIRARSAEGSLHVSAQAPQSGRPLGEGRLTFIDNRVDQVTGTIQLKASFPNQEGGLWPGQFVNVVLTLATDPAATVVPTPAVQMGQSGRYVFVVAPDQTAELRQVSVAREVGQETVIASGVSPGETVVTDGQLRLVPGAKVDARPAGQTVEAQAPAAGSPRR
jgi:multidrug efflux system membrane fusion protein